MVQPNGKQRISKIDTYLNVTEAFAVLSMQNKMLC